jgi:hypothetical protein
VTLVGNCEEAKRQYTDAIKQPSHMDNQLAVKKAQHRLVKLAHGSNVNMIDQIYFA